jgi:hypothetical protein
MPRSANQQGVQISDPVFGESDSEIISRFGEMHVGRDAVA